MERIIIHPPLRIHLNLHAMHKCKFRKNGGIGFAVNHDLKLVAERSATSQIHYKGKCTDKSKVESLIQKLEFIKSELKLAFSANISISGNLYFHRGLGLGTALTLASIECLLIINECSYSEEDVCKLSNRGGTSGIGINTYFSGGVILDGGVRANNSPHQPSSFTIPDNKPIPICRHEIPDWNITFAIPGDGVATNGLNEKKFFEENTPISKREAYEATYISLMAIMPSFIENDAQTLCTSLLTLRKTKWKQLEIELSNEGTRKLLKTGDRLDIATGMSSMGPGVFYITNNSKIESLMAELSNQNVEIISLTPNNQGRVISKC